LPGMVFAAIRGAPQGDAEFVGCDAKAAETIRGALSIVTKPHWVAAIATDWWAANRAIEAIRPRFRIAGTPVSTTTIHRALDDALKGPGVRVAAAGDVGAAFKGASIVTATYRADPALHVPVE